MSLIEAKPFLKWAGGKTQLLPEISNKIIFPKNKKKIYIEPFVGSGAVLFWILNTYPEIELAVINDINLDLINCYKVIKNHLDELISILNDLQNCYYLLLSDQEKKSEFYYTQRELFNQRKSDQILQSALFIFLNRTCFNGLYRVNKKNQFNVPIGNYKKPLICNQDNLRAVNQALQKVEILHGDFENTLKYAQADSIFYLDPPYKPLTSTSNFNSYASNEFDDHEQIRLKQFCDQLDKLNCQWILSNSDVKSANPDDNFFDDLYQNYQIKRVLARRNINSHGSKRGHLNELLISNN
jgi:DNA adenine methylase